MGNEKNVRRILIRIAVALDREIAAVADDVRIRHDALAIDHETGADAALNAAGIPRRFVVRLDFRRRDADQTALNLSVGTRGDRRRRDILNGNNRGTGRSVRFRGRSRRAFLLRENFSTNEEKNRP